MQNWDSMNFMFRSIVRLLLKMSVAMRLAHWWQSLASNRPFIYIGALQPVTLDLASYPNLRHAWVNTRNESDSLLGSSCFSVLLLLSGKGCQEERRNCQRQISLPCETSVMVRIYSPSHLQNGVMATWSLENCFFCSCLSLKASGCTFSKFGQDAWKVEFAAASSTFPKTQQTMRPANRASAKALSSLVVTCFGSTVVNMKVVIHVFNLRLSS